MINGTTENMNHATFCSLARLLVHSNPFGTVVFCAHVSPPFFSTLPVSFRTNTIYPCSREIATFITTRADSKSAGSTHQLHNKCQAVVIYTANEID